MIANLEQAARVFLSDPSKVTDDERKSSELIFNELRNSNISFETCKQIIENTTNEFVVFQTVQSVRESTIRQWVLLDRKTIDSLWKYLLHYAVYNENLSKYLVSELLQTVAIIQKRGIFDEKWADFDAFYSRINQMIDNSDVRLQSLACQTLESVNIEFASCWRSENLGISWDFHIRAKRCFEALGLKKALDIALVVLETTLNRADFDLSNRNQTELCHRLLSFCESVLNWNFGSIHLPQRLTYSLEFSGTCAFRPPNSWTPLFEDAKLLCFFFEMYKKVRGNEQLNHCSFQCLIHLASLMGEVFQNVANDKYIQVFVCNILTVFDSGPLPHEVYNCCEMLSKLLSFHPLPSFFRLPPSLLGDFLTFLTRLASQLCTEAVKPFPVDCHSEYGQSLNKLLNVWVLFVRVEGRLISDGTFAHLTRQLFSAFFLAILGPPLGSRPCIASCASLENLNLQTNANESLVSLLIPIGEIARNCIVDSIPLLARTISEKLTLFEQFISTSNADLEWLTIWNQDMHWLFLLLGNILTISMEYEICLIPNEIDEYTDEMRKNGRISNQSSLLLIESSISGSDFTDEIAQVDPIVQLISLVIRWGSLEFHLLEDGNMQLLSRQLIRTTLWCLRRLTSAFSGVKVSINIDEDGQQTNQLVTMCPRPRLEIGTPQSQMLVDFLLSKVFLNISAFPDDDQLVEQATLLLDMLIINVERVEQVVNSGKLVQQVERLDLYRLSSSTRNRLLTTLVQVGAATENVSIQQHLYLLVLDPLATRFHHVISGDSHVSELSEMLTCFHAVVRAVQAHSADFLFKFLLPILQTCPDLLSGPYKDEQPLVDCVLLLFLEMTDKLVMFISDDEDDNSEQLYQLLLTLIGVYSNNQLAKYRNEQVQEDTASDLAMVMNIFNNVLSRELMLMIDGGVLTIYQLSHHNAYKDNRAEMSRVTLLGLQTVLPLMTADLLHFPVLCRPYYRLLVYFTEMCPESVRRLDSQLMASLLHSANLGLSAQYGVEVCQMSLEIIEHLATIFASPQIFPTMNVQFQRTFGDFVKPVFESCLVYSSKVDIFGDATNALFSIICCDKAVYDNMVEQVIVSHEEHSIQCKLREAFAKLAPECQQLNPTRREKRNFRDRFETFLNDIQGLLCLQLKH